MMQEKKRVCILRSNPVNPDSRVEKEAESLHEAGFEVEILCWDRASNHAVRTESILDGRVPIHRVGYKAAYGAGMKSIIPYLKFQLFVRRWIKKHGKEFDAFHACDFDTAFFAKPVIKKSNARFVFDIFDFICGDPRTFVQRIVNNAQLKLITDSDLTIICTEDRKMQISGSCPKKLIVIHNSPDSSMKTIPPSFQINKLRVSVVYVGVLLNNRLLVEISEYFQKHQEMDFYIAGFGQLEEYFKRISELYSNIHYLGKISYEETIGLEQECDIMTSIYDPNVENHRFAASNKYYEALMLGKPVIVVKHTGMWKTVQENNIGAVIEYSEKGFSQGMSEIINNRDHWDEISQKMKKIYHENYDWRIMKDRLIAAYNEILQ